MYIPTRYIDTTEVEKAVDAFIKTLGPEVVRVRYNIGEDWEGDPALYFRDRPLRLSFGRHEDLRPDGTADPERAI